MAKGKRIKENDKKKKKKWILILLLLLLLIIGIVVFINYKKEPLDVKFSSGKAGEEQSVDENEGDYKKEISNDNGKNVILPGYGEIKIKANTTNITSGIDFYNPQKNDGYYYLKFQLKIGDEVLYESDLVSPGKHIQKIKLTRPLKAGTYDATVFIQPYRWDKKTPTNYGIVKVKLSVIN